ncbi:STAS domain-containing protein [Jannaschia seohaensis]|uniref:STAS domain-containing protein n=1 Tax=Jannaschia seohaensis TaxID=475081 RepID=A0A2Y9C8M0_9RHOB|nr:STAS domain-containing protein [Jannaschia seohaensis]PWJ15859.1 STAS domain-containing protein [Jannaschia seohaensis]SSA49563.1 STAS domain-containing protein [Jannaschia seohaensis]
MSTSPAPPTAEDTALTLAPRQDLGSARRLRDWFLAQSGDVTVDATAVEIVTTPALQVLLAGTDHVRSQGGSVEIRCPSAAFTRCLADLGCTVDRLTKGAQPVGGV